MSQEDIEFFQVSGFDEVKTLPQFEVLYHFSELRVRERPVHSREHPPDFWFFNSKLSVGVENAALTPLKQETKAQT